MADRRQEAAVIKRDGDARIKQIMSNGHLSPAGKKAQVLKELNATNTKIKALRTEHMNGKEADKVTTLRALVKAGENPPAFRAAMEQAEKIATNPSGGTNTGGLVKLIQRAANTGDPELARAALAVAFEKGSGMTRIDGSQILDAYAQAFPEQAGGVQAYRNARIEANGPDNRMFNDMAFSRVDPPSGIGELFGNEYTYARGDVDELKNME